MFVDARIVYVLEGCFCINHVLKYEHLTIFWITLRVQFAIAIADLHVVAHPWGSGTEAAAKDDIVLLLP
jgi:hypothetical protein